MNWNPVLTKVKRFFGIKKKMPKSFGRQPDHEPIPQLVSIKEAVEALPEEMIKELSNRKFKGIKAHGIKLTQPMQIELMEFIARYATMDEINEYFIQNYKVSVSKPLIEQYKRTLKWKPVIAKLREKYLLNPGDVAMSHKRVRLDRREKIYSKAMNKDDLKTALSAVQGSTEEMEESKYGGINLNFNQFNTFTDEEIENKKREFLERLKNQKAIEVKSETVTEGRQPGVAGNGTSPKGGLD